MRDEYDFSDARENPYAAQLKESITIQVDPDIIDYFKAMADETGIPYQSLINLYLRDCVATGRKISLAWE